MGGGAGGGEVWAVPGGGGRGWRHAGGRAGRWAGMRAGLAGVVVGARECGRGGRGSGGPPGTDHAGKTERTGPTRAQPSRVEPAQKAFFLFFFKDSFTFLFSPRTKLGSVIVIRYWHHFPTT